MSKTKDLLSLMRRQAPAVNKIVSKARTAKKTANKGATVKSNSLTALCDTVQRVFDKYRDDFVCIQNIDDLHNYISVAIQNNEIAIDTETTGLDPICDEIVGACIYTPNQKPAYIPINHISNITHCRLTNQLTNEQVAEEFKRLIKAETKIIYFNAKFDIRVMRHSLGIDLPNYWDAMIASKVLKYNEEEGNLKYLWKKYCSEDKESPHLKFGDLFKGYCFNLIPINTAYLYAANDAKMTHELYKYQEEWFKREGCEKLYWVFRNIENPVVRITADIEDSGVTIDTEYCKRLSVKYHAILDEKLEAFYRALEPYKDKIIGWRSTHPNSKITEPLNVNSPTQLAELFYDVLGLEPVSRKQPRGTGEEILLKLNHPLSQLILDFRGVNKLITTYIDKMPEIANKKTGKIHCSFKTIGADTSRFACIAEDSMISMPGGDKKIRDVRPGDYVYGYTEDGKLTLEKVKNVWFTGNRDCVRLDWDHKSLICTPDHRIKTTKGWVEALQIISEHKVYSTSEMVTGIKITELKETYNVYDVEVENIHNFIANELCVHNCSDPNMQNIPSRNHDIRKMFTASNSTLLSSSNNKFIFMKSDIVPTTIGNKKSIDLQVRDILICEEGKYKISKIDINEFVEVEIETI